MPAAATVKTSRPKTRRDPVRRTNDGVSPLARLENQDPNRKYVWVNPNDQYYGVEFYESIGYEVEQRREGGVKQVGGGRFARKAPGESHFTFQGQILMSIPREEADEIEALGAFENAGQAWADALEARILSKAAARGLTKGIRGVEGREGPVVRAEQWEPETSDVTEELVVTKL